MASIDAPRVTKVYSGKKGRCACGCAGKYWYPNRNLTRAGVDRGYAISKDEISDKQVKRIVNLLNNNLVDVVFDEGGDFVYVHINERIYVAYFD